MNGLFAIDLKPSVISRVRLSRFVALPVGGMLLIAIWLKGEPWAVAAAEAYSEKELEFFEKRVRPALVKYCFECHTEKQKGGLRLDSRQGVLQGGETGLAVEEGNGQSGLLIEAIEYGADSFQMPPDGRLPDSVIHDFKRWVSMGLPWPNEAAASLPAKRGREGFQISAEQRSFWSFQPLAPVAPPAPSDRSWVQNEIDAFVLSALEAKGLEPAKPASKEALIRRATFDLIGLPPTPGEIRAFLADEFTGAFAKVVDRLLSSPHYGERWARHWFDGVRYVSDVGYYNFSDHGWRYRDWVVKAFNNDMPYDDFIVHQIAGDLMSDPQGRERYADGIIATGVLAMGNYDDQESDKEKLYAEVIDDQIDLVGRQFLGLTLSCARCHDHKFDPISTADYYSLGGVFMSSHVLETKSRIGAHRLKIPIEPAENLRRYEATRQAVKELEKSLRNVEQTKRERIKKLQRELRSLRQAIPLGEGLTIGIRDGGPANSRHSGIGDMSVYIRGNPYQLGPKVSRAVPAIFSDDGRGALNQSDSQSGRMELARWIASEDNPLTARVMVNRVWQYHFGRGLVSTPNNFGIRGERPTHPQLLDFLATVFVRSGWSLKHLHRLMMNSAVYQQSTQAGASSLESDPENRYLGRFSPRRLSAEEINDSLLAVSGRLRRGVGQGLGNRAVYRRIGHLHTSLVANLFDAPATGTIRATRHESTTAPQALYLMNDQAVVSASRSLASLLGATERSDVQQIRQAYQTLYGREVTERELRAGEQYLSELKPERRWVYFQVLLCSNEFIHVD